MLRATLLALALALAAVPAAAQRTYAMLSAVGDRITVVHRDVKRQDTIDISGTALDNAVLFGAEKGLRTAERTADVMRLAPRTGLAAKADLVSREGSMSQWVAREVRPQLSAMGVDDIIVITKHRGETEGLGFYTDGAPASVSGYAALVVRLFELESGRLLAEQVVAANAPLSGAGSAWNLDTITDAQIVAVLRDMVNSEMGTAMAALVRSAGRGSPGRR